MPPDTDGRAVDPERIAAFRAEVADNATVPALANRLDSEDADERAGAAWSLVESARKRPSAVRDVLDAVLDAVDDPDVWVQRGATWVLAELADERPAALADRFDDLAALATVEDPLVRQNAVFSVAAVTRVDPSRASRGLSTLAALTHADDALVRRYATDAVHDVTSDLAERASAAGRPLLVRTSAQFADRFPAGVEVVEVDADERGGRPVQVSFGAQRPSAETPQDPIDDRSAPESVPESPDVSLHRDELSPGLTLREGVLVTDYKAAVAEATLEHGLATYRELTAKETTVCREFREALERWAAVQDHEHVTTMLGRGARWIVQEYLDGDTLAWRGAPQTLPEAVWTAASVTRAVSYGHSRGVIHGGLHPGVVRFVPTGDEHWDAPTVADWGFANAASGVRTPPIPAGYAAPEHYDPDRFGRFDQATDVFGLGAVTYALLTGTPPFASDRRPEDGPVAATDRNPALPDSADGLFRRALAASKPARFATVLDFQAALDDFAADLTGVA